MQRRRRTRAEIELDYEPLQNGQDELERELPRGALAVPRNIWLNGGRLVWSPFASANDAPAPDPESPATPYPVSALDARIVDGRVVKPKLRMLIDFAELGRTVDEVMELEEPYSGRFAQDALRFAQRWGVLNLCDRNLPLGHPDMPLEATLRPPRRFDPQRYWRGFAGQHIAVAVQALGFFLLDQSVPHLVAERVEQYRARSRGGNTDAEQVPSVEAAVAAVMAQFFSHYPATLATQDPAELTPLLSFSVVSDAAFACIKEDFDPVFGEVVAETVAAALARVIARNPSEATIMEIIEQAAEEVEQTRQILPQLHVIHRCLPVEHAVPLPQGTLPPAYDEPLDAWAHYARQAYRILQVASHISSLEYWLKNAKPADHGSLERAREHLVDRWVTLESRYLPNAYSLPTLVDGLIELRRSLAHCSPDIHRELLASYADRWIALANVRTTLENIQASPPDREGEGPTAALSTGLFGFLGVQMRALITGIERLAQCPECAGFFIPTARSGPKRGRRCGECAQAGRSKRDRKPIAQSDRDARAGAIVSKLGLTPGDAPASAAADIRRALLGDHVWASLVAECPALAADRPRGIGERELLTGVMLLVRDEEFVGHRLQWGDLPPELGCGTGATCNKRLAHWHESGAWPALRGVLQRHLPHITDEQWSRAERLGRHGKGSDEGRVARADRRAGRPAVSPGKSTR